MIIQEYADNAIPLIEVARVIRAMRHRDVEKMAKDIEKHRLGAVREVQKKKSSKALSATDIVDWANAFYQANKKA